MNRGWDQRRPRNITTPHRIGSLLASAQREAARAAGVGPVDRETWRQVVGDRIADRTVVDSLRSGALEVRVASSVWAQELSLLSSEIMDRLRRRGIVVSRIRFRVGTVPRMDTAEPLAPPPDPMPLPEDLRARLADVDDPELSAAIARAASYSLARANREGK
jgi:predicted nucleic acid-binding Zn ribbon protein